MSYLYIGLVPRLRIFSFSTIMSFNATLAASMQETLYPGLEFSSLNWLEKQWAAWYIWIANPVIATGLMSFLLHEVGTTYSST